MPNRCVAYGCGNTTSVQGITTYYFPNNARLRQEWVAQVRRTRDKWTGPSGHSVLCNNHFSQDCFEESFEIGKSFGITGRRRQLKDNAIPTIFKRKIDDTLTDSNPVPKKRRAYEKRERRRVSLQ